MHYNICIGYIKMGFNVESELSVENYMQENFFGPEHTAIKTM
jgi:hypothetical protein